ncbi:MAG: FtsX-like permease family protein [Pseudomonadota bacterium]
MKRYLKIALRQLAREKLYTLLNVSGLALGIACCLMLGLYLWGELTYDRHHVNHERIYRIATEMKFGDGHSSELAITSSPLGPMLAGEYPEYFKSYVRFRDASRPTPVLLRHDDEKAYWDHVYAADENVFDVFTHEIVYGDPHTALAKPGSIAISRRMAQRYFGNENPIGRTLTTDGGRPLNVTLVFEELPENSHLRYNALIAYKGRGAEVPADITARLQQLLNMGHFEYTYVELTDGADPREYPRLSQAFYEKHMMVALKTAANLEWRSWIEPLADIHLGAGLEYDLPHGNRIYLYAFAAVAAFILVVACINYVNLATARAARRTRAIGLRKILGAGRATLIAQFLGESVLFALLATVLGVVLVEVLLSLPAVSALFGKTLTLDLFGRPWLALSVLAFGVCVGLAAGLYPAVYLSSFMPLTALVGRYRSGGLRLREALVFIQFAISIGVIACTLLMSEQMRFIASIGLGFDKENRVLLTLRDRDLVGRESLIATELGKQPGVLGVATTSFIMGRDIPHGTGKVQNNDGAMTDLDFSLLFVGDDFIPVMGIELVKGRDFSRRLLTDVGSTYIVNETFVRRMGWDDALGKRMTLGGGAFSGPVIGVVKDFNYKSLHTSIEPLVIVRNGDGNDDRIVVVSIAPDGIRETLQHIQKLFAQLDPIHPFEYTFLDEELDRLYVSEERLMKLIGIFAAICILVACLGLFGLAASATEQRTKEIGIRKVLGASTLAIILLLARRVLMLIGAGAIVASIVAWLAMQQWLSGFAYRAALNPAYLLLAALGAGAVALLTIALQSRRTARADPVAALRYE